MVLYCNLHSYVWLIIIKRCIGISFCTNFVKITFLLMFQLCFSKTTVPILYRFSPCMVNYLSTCACRSLHQGKHIVKNWNCYLGHETKAMLNNRNPRYKRSKLERRINRDVIYCVILLLFLCLFCAIGKAAVVFHLKHTCAEYKSWK